MFSRFLLFVLSNTSKLIKVGETMASKYGAARSCAKGKARSGKKRIGTRGATFKDAPRAKSSVMPKMVKSFIAPVPVAPVESMDSGATALSFERETVSRHEVPINEVPWVYREEERDVKKRVVTKDARGNTIVEVITVRELVIVDRPRRGWSAGALTGRKIDKRKLSTKYEPGRSDKASIGKTKPITDRTPVIDTVPKSMR